MSPKEEMSPKDMYLGDGVYVRTERECLVIYTHNGVYATNSIYFEPEVLESLVRYLRFHEVIV